MTHQKWRLLMHGVATPALRLVPILALMLVGAGAPAQSQAASPLAADAPAPHQPAPVVQTDKGRVRGVVEANGVLGYKGIPYAADPAGVNRFLPPKPPRAWNHELDASSLGPACPQNSTIIGDRPQAEDCLRVSVWTTSLTGKRPVVVWLHGGAYTIGSDDYSAEGVNGAFAAKPGDYVFVSLTHRLNVLGFLQLGPQFGPQYASSGNVGLLDIVAALTWVKMNIAKFGGDPDNVTIAGPSGGGSRVMYLMATPQAQGLFHRGIVFVGGGLLGRNPKEAALRSGAAVLGALGVAPGDIRKLQSLPVDALVKAPSAATQPCPPESNRSGPCRPTGVNVSAVIDGRIVPEHPIDAIAGGASRNIDLIIAVDQWTHWSPERLLPDSTLYGRMSWTDLAQALQPTLGERTDHVIAQYRELMPGASPSSLAARILTIRNWWIPALRLAEAKAKGGNPGRVVFDSVSAGSHSFFFGTNLPKPFAHALLGQVQGAYAAFARTGDPNYPGIPAWPVYTPQSRDVLMLDYNVHVAQDPFRAERLIWEDLR